MVSNYALFAVAIALVQGSKALPTPIKEILLSCVCLGALWGGSIMSAQSRLNEDASNEDEEAPKGWQKLRFNKAKKSLVEAPAKQKSQTEEANKKEQQQAQEQQHTADDEGDDAKNGDEEKTQKSQKTGEGGLGKSALDSDGASDSMSTVPILMYSNSCKEGSSSSQAATTTSTATTKAVVMITGWHAVPELCCHLGEALMNNRDNTNNNNNTNDNNNNNDNNNSNLDQDEVIYIVGYPFVGQKDSNYGAESGETFLEEEADHLAVVLKHLAAKHAGNITFVANGLGCSLLSKSMADFHAGGEESVKNFKTIFIDPLVEIDQWKPWQQALLHSTLATALFGVLSAMLSTLPTSMQRHIICFILGTRKPSQDVFARAEKAFLGSASYWPCELRLLRSSEARRGELLAALERESFAASATVVDIKPDSLFEQKTCDELAGRLREKM